jgi:hypothetical protein
MLDVDIFLTILYVMVDDLFHCRRPKRRPGPKASLSESEVITLAISARWGRFASERDFYRYAQTKLRGAFPTLPDRSQFNRLVRSQVGLIEEVALYLAAEAMGNSEGLYQALDSSAMPVRDAKRRGNGWFAGFAYTSAGPTASDGTKASACSPLRIPPGRHRLLFWGRIHRRPATGGDLLRHKGRSEREAHQRGIALPGTLPRRGKGFEGEDNHRRWLEEYGARVIHPPQRNPKKRSWLKRLRRWVASIRQVVETVYDKLFNAFGLWRERPHELEGLRARLAARVALHNFCIWLNEKLGRPGLAFADLLGW